MSMYQTSDYPVITVTSRTVLRQGGMPLFYTQIGSVSYWMHQGILVRVATPTTVLCLNSTTTVNGLFPGETVGRKVSLSELKFHLLRLLGEEALNIIDPFVDKALGVNDP